MPGIKDAPVSHSSGISRQNVELPSAMSIEQQTGDVPVQIKVAKTEDELDQLRKSWAEQLNHPNTDLDFFLSIINRREQVIRPHVLTISNGDTVIPIALARLEKAHFDLRFGYRIIARPKLVTLRVIHGNNFEVLSEKMQNAILTELRGALGRKEAEILVFDSLEVGSVMDLAIRSSVSPWTRKCFAISSPHWQIKLAGSFDDYLLSLSRTTRKGLRRRIRTLEQKYSDSLSVRRLSDQNDFEKMFADMQRVSEKTYQHKIGTGFQNSEETRQTMSMALRAGTLSSLVAYLDGTPVAFDNASRYGKTLYLDNGGYDPHCAEDGLGTYLLVKQIEAAFEGGLIDTIDFGSGDSSYKTSMCNSSWDEYSTHIFASNLKGKCMNLVCIAVSSAHNLTSHVLKRLGIFEKIRNTSRRYRLVTSSNKDGT